MTIDPTQPTTEDCWSCPTCAFTFAAYHANADGSLTCPVCEVEERDRRIAEWEREYEKIREELGSANDAVLAAGKVVAEIESRLATAHDMLRHYEQERDSWGAAYKQRAAMTDARIKELEAGLRGALGLVRHEPTWLSEDEIAVAARLRTSEET